MASAAQTYRRDNHISLVKKTDTKIVDDEESHLEHRWYEVWDSILNYISQSASPRQLSIAPQYSLAREILKDVNEEDDPDASMVANASFNTQSSYEGGTNDGIAKEFRVPDFLLVNSTVEPRHIVLLVEIKSLILKNNLIHIDSLIYEQITVQVGFAFETQQFRHQRCIYAMAVVGTHFRMAKFERHHVGLPSHSLKANTISSFTENASSPSPNPAWSTLRDVFSRNPDGTIVRYSTSFKNAINHAMAEYGLQVTW